MKNSRYYDDKNKPQPNKAKETTMKQINWIMLALTALVLGAAIPAMTGCNKSEPATSGNAAVKYTCPMHPDVVRDAPGNCPKCSMKLVEKK
jgi:Heavy metal binding domain